MTKKPTKTTPIHKVVVVLDQSGDEAIYFNGLLRYSGTNAYMCDLSHVVGRRAFRLLHRTCHPFDGDWPHELKQLKLEKTR